MLVLAAVIGGLILLTDDEGSEPVEPVVERNPEEVAAELSERTLTESLEKGDAGITGAYPDGWSRSEESGIVNLESPDRCVVVTVSAPVGANQANMLRRDTIAPLGRSFEKIEVRPGPKQELGGVPTSGATVAVRTKQGSAVVVRIAVGKGRKFAYLTQVTYRAPPCEAASAQVDLILDSLEFSR